MESQPLIASDDAFLGIWVLDPARSDYEFGQPPKSGVYHISTDGERYRMDIAWTDQADQEFEVSYEAIPDGVEYPYEAAPAADRVSVSMTRVDERTLDSASFKDGKQIAYARRVLSADGTFMTITQSGLDGHGREYSNLSVYEKQF